MVKIYQYPQCSTCRKAIKWFEANDIEFESIHIVDSPPSAKELKGYWARSELPIKKFFNTSGKSYREGGFSEKLKTMTDTQALDALAADGKMIKRPLVIADDAVLVGFKEETYAKTFS